ncbi:hypothetical protein Tco_0672411 [Tanacetum coccineum]
MILNIWEEEALIKIYDINNKDKVAKYDIEGIEDMVPKLWSPIKVAYDKHAALDASVMRTATIAAKPCEGDSFEFYLITGSIPDGDILDVPRSQISNKASTSSHLVPHDRWSKDQHIELVNIIGDPCEGLLTRSMAAKLIAASTSECLFADFLSKIEPKKVSEALKHP